jgi:hypothetical protein
MAFWFAPTNWSRWQTKTWSEKQGQKNKEKRIDSHSEQIEVFPPLSVTFVCFCDFLIRFRVTDVVQFVSFLVKSVHKT